MDHRLFYDELDRQRGLREHYKRLNQQHPDKLPERWFGTHGIERHSPDDRVAMATGRLSPIPLYQDLLRRMSPELAQSSRLHAVQ